MLAAQQQLYLIKKIICFLKYKLPRYILRTVIILWLKKPGDDYHLRPITKSDITVNDYNETKHQEEAEIVSALPP